MRARLEWSQSELARFLCVADSTVARWESGERKATGPIAEVIYALDLASKVSANNVERLKRLAKDGETFRSMLKKFFDQAFEGVS